MDTGQASQGEGHSDWIIYTFTFLQTTQGEYFLSIADLDFLVIVFLHVQGGEPKSIFQIGKLNAGA